MKITSVDVFEFERLDFLRPICVRINTDEGISGFGEVGLAYGRSHHAGVGIARDFGEMIIGMDPLNIEKIWHHLFYGTFWGHGGGTVINAGMSAIDIALWDIKGKAYGQPVYQLLGGKTNDKIRAYASQIQFDWDVKHVNLAKPEDYAAAARKALAQGYTAVKVDPVGVTDQGLWARDGGDPDWKMTGILSPRIMKAAIDRVKAIREVDEKMDIIIELHSLTDSNSAIQLGKALEPYNIYYYEEPVYPLNPGSMLEIRKKLDMPIASGERIYTRWGYRDFLEKRALQVIQPDVCLVGGITETKKICDMAHVYDAIVQIHICGGPIATAAALQIEATIPNFIIHELHEGALKTSLRSICKYDWMPENGYYTVPELPGIGQELTEEAMAKAVCYTAK
jgi:L-alanine-DL-glutamate epimerase-like enolase superfamily enzyme